jgi:hypothetical protein
MFRGKVPLVEYKGDWGAEEAEEGKGVRHFE